MRPLEGLRVVTLALNLPGPAAARRLRQLGARVIKVEPPAGDPMEQYLPEWYRDLAVGQTVLRLDLKATRDRERLGRLLANADLLITATRPAALARLALDWPTLHGDCPRLCQVAIVGFPAPRQNEAGHDLTYQAAHGLLSPPQMPRTLLSDMAGAEQSVAAALALLLARERSGAGGYAEVALAEAAAAMAEPLRYATTLPGGNLGGGIPEYNLYAAEDGWVAVAALEPHFKERLEEGLGIRTGADYRRVFATRRAADWQAWGERQDVPIAVVRQPEDDAAIQSRSVIEGG
jgi:crotonobetainyl-CoA:carnitine CoA-transferase CaiB-like acyl-CoA transferase